ncbi:MAG TPA: TonB-dependent receptor [Bacteroidota bacterium]
MIIPSFSHRFIAIATVSVVVLLPCLAVSQALKTPDSTRTVLPDSLSVTRSDSALAADSLRIRFIPAIGSMRQQIDSSGAFHSSQLLWTDDRWFGNLAWRLPGFFLRDLGESGKPGELNAWGEDWRGIAILMDGRPMNDPITGTYNLYDIPMEFVEQLEEFSGVSSLGQSWNAPGSTLNFVTRQYNTLHPITKIRYVQSPNNDLMTDGLFSQNLLRGLNFMFGFQRRVSDGRFNGSRTTSTAPVTQGAIVDDWNVRTRLRFNFSDRLNVALTDFYTKDINGMNGGVDYARSSNVFDDIAAFVINPNALETVSRRDVSLLAIGKFTDDSTMITQANAYYTHLERSFSNPGSQFNLLDISDSHYAEVRGARVQQSFHAGYLSATGGIQYEHSQYSSSGLHDSTQLASSVNNGKRTISSVFLTTSLRPAEITRLDVDIRYDNGYAQPAASYGAGVTLFPASPLELFADYGRSYRFPTFQETSWADSSILRPAPIREEQHTLMRAGVRFTIADLAQLSLTGFDRRVNDAIVFQPATTDFGSSAVRILNVPHVQTRGLAGSLNLSYSHFTLLGTLLYTHYTEADTAKLLSPDLILSGELSYRNKFFRDALDAKFGLRTHFMNGQRGMTFVPRTTMYVENTLINIGRWTRLDLFAVLKIGDAYITLSYENLLSANYLITPIYPMPDRIFRFGVNWAFFD